MTNGSLGTGAALRRWASARWRQAGLAIALFALLLLVNLVLNPRRFAIGNWGELLGLAAPLLLAAVAVMPAFLVGRGSIDVSVGPLMGLINVSIVQLLIIDAGVTSPWVIVPFALAAGILAGALNGALAAYVRVQPIVATLGTYLVFAGLALTILPSPAGDAPQWLRALSGGWSILPLGAAALLWLSVKRSPFHTALIATGSDDRAAYTSGIDVPLVQFLAYVLGGAFAGLAALALTALIGSGDPAIGPGYTLIAVAAAALGGVSLAGGVGGFVSAAFGAADIFLLQSILTYFNVSSFVLQLAYGVILVLAVCLNAEVLRARLGWRGAR